MIIQDTSNLTPVQKVVARQRDSIRGIFNQMVEKFQELSRFVWQNPLLKPQQVLDLWGADAAELFRVSNAFCAMMEAWSGQPVKVIPDTYTYVINQDGTVTVTKVEEPQPS